MVANPSPLVLAAEHTAHDAPSVTVALVNMPFAMVDRPSIQCGLLKAALTRFGHRVDVHYLNLELALTLGRAAYEQIAEHRSDELLGDWLFAVAAFGDRGDEEAYRAACPGVERTCARIGLSWDELCRLRREVLPATVARWAEGVDWGRYAVIGFTSVFEQNVAALALARQIKRRFPHVITVFGGANFEAEMGPEQVRAFPWIDYAVIGEADETFPALVNRLARGERGAGLPGVVYRENGRVAGDPAPGRVFRMDRLPDPNYDEYFETLFRLGREQLVGDYPPVLPFESARGCWWGQKHHCTFCGLNAGGMTFRSRSPETVAGQLRRLAARYHIANFQAVDNIMDLRYLEALFPALVAARLDYAFFYEVKANLTREQVRTLARGGVHSIQPGIESFSTHILKLMRKGTTMLRNIRLLKWAHYYGMRIGWNILCGFPGERPEDYDQQAKLLPLLFHLPPPSGAGRIWLERFSPYYADPSFPVRNKRPRRAYRFIYPEGVDLDKIAYYFDYEMDDTLPDEAYRPLQQLVDEWKARWNGPNRPLLVYQRAPDWLQIIDKRDPSAPRALALHGLEADAYEFCSDTDHSAERVASHLQERHGSDVTTAAVEAILHRLCRQGLMVHEDGHFLSLALPVNPNW